MTFDIGLNEVCVRVGVLYVKTKFSRMDSLPNFVTHGAPLRARFARARAPLLFLILFCFCIGIYSIFPIKEYNNCPNPYIVMLKQDYCILSHPI